MTEVPNDWRVQFQSLLLSKPIEYSRILGGTGACADGEISYRTASPSGLLLADIAGFYTAFGFPHPQGGEEKPDHIAVELEFVGFLYAKEALARNTEKTEEAQITQKGRNSFLQDHVSQWVSSFAEALASQDPEGFHTLAAKMVVRAVGEEVPVQPAQRTREEEISFQCPGGLP
jgi:nitrate reductase assembly molybdenum cofactor insertion protein NarJ